MSSGHLSHEPVSVPLWTRLEIVKERVRVERPENTLFNFTIGDQILQKRESTEQQIDPNDLLQPAKSGKVLQQQIDSNDLRTKSQEGYH